MIIGVLQLELSIGDAMNLKDKRRIVLAEPIKIISESMVPVKLVHGVTAEFKVVVEKEA